MSAETLIMTVLFGGLPLMLATWCAYGPVSRARLEGFAQKQRLDVTVGNGDRVIAYLAVTRRWRCAGAGLGCAIGFAWGLPEGRFQVNFLALFAGWFVGALVAELALARVRRGTRRAASLAVRTLATYLVPLTRGMLPLAAVVLTAASIVVLMHRAPQSVPAAAMAWIGFGTAILSLVTLVRRQVVTRARPVAEPDVLAADDAIRTRSLHVLTSGGFVLAGFSAISAVNLADPDAAAVRTVFGGLLVLLCGIVIAAGRGPQRQGTS
ncbi:hypothetical protein ABZ671_14415 [Micromonospora sp. NPDC006766]|uniref:hypothetical protein n=1 Tax=Micromonospora sp. NPDC006766 TaxID=3154778 RepID=UPI0033CC7C09